MKVAGEIKSGYLTQLREFKHHVETDVTNLIDELTKTGEYDEQHDLILTVNGKQCRIEMHADAYDRLLLMLENEIKEFIEMNADGNYNE